MSYFINPVEEEQCVFLAYEGEMPPIEAVAVRYEATAALAARHWNRIVVDFTELQSLTELELFVLAKGLSSDLPQNARVALVVRREQAKLAQSIENIVRNDGALLNFFFDAEKATAWVNGVKPYDPKASGIACNNRNERVSLVAVS